MAAHGHTPVNRRYVQYACFVLLSDILISTPEKVTRDCPQILVNGRLDVLRARYPTTDTQPQHIIEYPYADVNEE